MLNCLLWLRIIYCFRLDKLDIADVSKVSKAYSGCGSEIAADENDPIRESYLKGKILSKQGSMLPYTIHG